MRNLIILALVAFLFTSCKENTNEKDENLKLNESIVDTLDSTNDFYDNEKTFSLERSPIKIEGEIENPCIVDFSKLKLRSVLVKETLLSDSSNKFVGAYKYEGYSLYDILNNIKLKKKNYEEFNCIIDIYVQIENDKGEKVNISWGEIYYPNHLHEIIIATKVMRIIPTKTNDLWPIPEKCKLVVASDLITERNISNPTKITIKSYPKHFKTIKGLKPLFSPKVDIFVENNLVETLTNYPEGLKLHKFNTIFYGRGRGIHSTLPFTGLFLKDVYAKYVEFNKTNLQQGIFLVAAKDGYRVVYTFSEIMNRNDQSEILFLCRPELKDKGIFRLFPVCDFFSDRAIKGITEMHFSAKEK